MDSIRILSRGSVLASWQARWVASLLEAQGHETNISYVKTTGDRIQNRFLHEIGGKGVFIRELEQGLTRGEGDIAVHSLKDLPAEMPEGMELVACLPRHNPTDAMVLNPKSPLVKLISGKEVSSATQWNDICESNRISIATGSLRRKSLLAHYGDENLDVIPIRGNVDTRLKKLEENGWDGIILATAGLERLELLDQLEYRLLSPTWFTPSSCQGIVAIEMTKGHPLKGHIKRLNSPQSFHSASIERAILHALGGDCTLPIGCHSQWFSKEQELQVSVDVFAEGCPMVQSKMIFPMSSDCWNGSNQVDAMETSISAIMDDLRSKNVEKLLKIHRESSCKD